MINASKRIPTAFRFLGVEFVPLGQTGSEYTFAGKQLMEIGNSNSFQRKWRKYHTSHFQQYTLDEEALKLKTVTDGDADQKVSKHVTDEDDDDDHYSPKRR